MIIQFPNVFNFDPNKYLKSLAGIAKVQANIANMPVAVLGTSIPMGQGANGTQVGSRAQSWPARLAYYANAAGIDARNDSFFGDGNTASQGLSYTAYDPRISVGTGFTASGALYALGGRMWTASSTSLSPLTFTPTNSFDRVTIYGVNAPGNGSIECKINGLTDNFFVQNAALAMSKVTFNAMTLAVQPIALTAPSVPCYIAGVETYNSAKSSMMIANFGRGLAKASDLTIAAQPFDPLNAFKFYAPTLTLISLSTNDILAAVSPVAFAADLQTLITAAKASGDVILVKEHPIDPSQANASLAVQQTYVATMKALALSNDIALVNLDERYQTYAALQAMGFSYDANHLLAAGYDDIARLIFKLLT